MILTIIRTFRTLGREYPLSRVILEGVPAVFRGLYSYYVNRRRAQTPLSVKSYVNYFIVLAVTGKDPLNHH